MIKVNGPGITADDNKYTVKVVVTDDGSGELKAEVTVTDKNGTPVNPEQMSFRNEFRSGSLQIGKIVTGNLADKSQPFPFQISFGATGSYSYSGSYSGTLSSGDTIRLKHGDQIVISGLPAGIKYTVKETDNAGYTVSATGDTGTITEGSVSKAIFTNTKNGSSTASPKTGDSSRFGLWLAALALSTVGVPVTLTAGKKKRR